MANDRAGDVRGEYFHGSSGQPGGGGLQVRSRLRQLRMDGRLHAHSALALFCATLFSLSRCDAVEFSHTARGTKAPRRLVWSSVPRAYPALGIWYWRWDQTIVPRALAAKDEKNARLGPLFCAFLKILPVFLFVLPGVICVALVQQKAFGSDAPQTAADTYTFLITHLLPVGLKGLVTAAMLAASMQTCSAPLTP